MDWHRDITITVNTFNRPVYTVQSLSSLYQHLQNKFRVVVADDKSSPANTDLFKRICKCFGFEFMLNNLNLGSAENNKARASRIDSKYILVLDNDAIYSHRLIDGIKLMYDILDSGNYDFASIYNSNRHESHGKLEPEVLLKETIGGLGMICNRRALLEYQNSAAVNDHRGWDWGLCEHVEDFPVTEISFLQHVGVFGEHSNSVTQDIGLNFSY